VSSTYQVVANGNVIVYKKVNS